jgi:MscS family membrane protein
MKLRFETWFRGFLVVLGLLLIWSVWVSAQGAPTNTPAATTVTAASVPQTGASFVEDLTGLSEDQLTFGLKNVPGLRTLRFLGEPLWKYLASAIYVFLAFYVARVLDYVLGRFLRRWAKRTATRLDDLVLDLVRGPVRVVAFVVLLHVGLNVFSWPAWVESWLSTALKIVVAASVTYLALRIVDLLLQVWQQRAADKQDEQFQRHLFPIIRKTLKGFVLIVAVLVAGQNLGFNITGLIASLSIGALAVGLAAQDTLANFFGAVAVLLDKPFHVGDFIRVENSEGIVESIGFRSIRVRNPDGHLVTIPNKTVASASVTNVALRPSIRTVINLGITYDCSRARIEEAKQLLDRVYRGHRNTQDVWISFNKFGDSALNLQVIHWWNNLNYQEYLDGMHELNLAVKAKFDEAGIAFAYPSQTVFLRQDPSGEALPNAPVASGRSGTASPAVPAP